MPETVGPTSRQDDFVAMDDPLLDLVVIGAGPHALSLLSRLVDDAPDLLSEKERVRIAHKAGSRGKSHATVRKHLQRKAYDGAEKLPRVVVIDAHGEWLAQWRADFEALDIRHTRSHSDLHPCPFDFASLRVWAEIKGRQSEMVEMDHLDRDHSRSLGYGGPFTLVGTSLFNDFCASLVDRYGLSPLVRAGKVVDVRIIPPASALPSTATDAMSACGSGDDNQSERSDSSSTPASATAAPIHVTSGASCRDSVAADNTACGVDSLTSPSCTFEVRLSDGSALTARRVVCAMGPGPAFKGMRATLPWWAEDLATSLAGSQAAAPAAALAAASAAAPPAASAAAAVAPLPPPPAAVPASGNVATPCSAAAVPAPGLLPSERLQHSSQLTTWLRGLHARGIPLAAILRDKRVLVVGGGQTAAHLSLLALRQGHAASVTLASRRQITVKPYDVDLEAVGDRRAEVLGKFWRMSERERLKYIGGLRGGGSMNHEARSELRAFEAKEVDGRAPLEVLEEVEVSEATWHEDMEAYTGDSGAMRLGGPGEIRVKLDDERTRSYDMVWLATGGNLDLSLVPIFSSLMAQRPIGACSGLPLLQPDLSWDADCPLYIMGAFAMLQLGPDALNLAGARSGGVIVAKALLEATKREQYASKSPPQDGAHGEARADPKPEPTHEPTASRGRAVQVS